MLLQSWEGEEIGLGQVKSLLFLPRFNPFLRKSSLDCCKPLNSLKMLILTIFAYVLTVFNGGTDFQQSPLGHSESQTISQPINFFFSLPSDDLVVNGLAVFRHKPVVRYMILCISCILSWSTFCFLFYQLCSLKNKKF